MHSKQNNCDKHTGYQKENEVSVYTKTAYQAKMFCVKFFKMQKDHFNLSRFSQNGSRYSKYLTRPSMKSVDVAPTVLVLDYKTT